MNVVLYTTHCRKCKVLETKLKQKGIEYQEVTDTAIMQEKGFEFMPVLEVDGVAYELREAAKWIGGLNA